MCWVRILFSGVLGFVLELPYAAIVVFGDMACSSAIRAAEAAFRDVQTVMVCFFLFLFGFVFDSIFVFFLFYFSISFGFSGACKAARI